MWHECFICGEQEETANHLFMYSKMKSEVAIHVFVFLMERVILGSIAIICMGDDLVYEVVKRLWQPRANWKGITSTSRLLGLVSLVFNPKGTLTVESWTHPSMVPNFSLLFQCGISSR